MYCEVVVRESQSGVIICVRILRQRDTNHFVEDTIFRRERDVDPLVFSHFVPDCDCKRNMRVDICKPSNNAQHSQCCDYGDERKGIL